MNVGVREYDFCNLYLFIYLFISSLIKLSFTLLSHIPFLFHHCISSYFLIISESSSMV